MITDLLEETIDPRHHLSRQGRDWQLAKDIRVRAPHQRSFGFSLDRPGTRPMAFLIGNPPADIAKMCDAIIALFHREVLYFFVIEQKTMNRDDYFKQLVNGKLFCDWLVSLYNYHGYLREHRVRTIEFIALLVWEPRQSPRKGGTSPRSYQPEQRLPFLKFFDLPNETLIPLKDLIG